MKKKMTVHRLLSGALVLLGFASCSNEDENLEIRCEYGTEKDVVALADHKKKKLTKKEQEATETEYQKRGMVLVTDIGFAILRHVNDAKADINKFLADLTGTSQREIESLSMLDYSKLLIDFGKKAELKDFFLSIASLLG
jgi:hypothetical protein